MTKKIWQLKIQCCDATKKCEVDSSYEIEDLCQFILDSYGFDNDHLHQFYFSNSGHPYGYDAENIDSSNKLCNILPREDKKKLFLLFDFGDEWIFKISKTAKAIVYNKSKKYPVVTELKGKNPEQYLDYDEDW